MLPPGYRERLPCSVEACTVHPFVDIQSLLVDAFDRGSTPPPPPPPPPPSERKGASGASVVSWDTGRFDAFGRGGGGKAYQTFFQRGGAAWPGWAPLSGSAGLRSNRWSRNGPRAIGDTTFSGAPAP